MSYQGAGEVKAIYRPEDEVDQLLVGSTVARLTASGSLTDGRYGLFRWDMAPGPGGASAHFHRTFSEAFFILSGTVGLYNGEAWVNAKPGDFLFVPEGGVHGFRPDLDAPSSMLILFAPGAPRERYFEELAEVLASGRKLSDEEWMELWARNDQYPVKT